MAKSWLRRLVSPLLPGSRHSQERRPRYAPHSRRSLTFETLEDRQMLAVFTVTNLNDATVTGAGQAPGTLRQAVFDANNLPGADVIQFSAGLSGPLQLSVVGDTAAGASALAITSAITIRGNANGITLERDPAAVDMRLFRVSSAGNLTLESIMLTGGVARGANGASPGMEGEIGRGGAILNQGTLDVVGSTLYNNQAIGGNATGAAGGRGIGGAIANDGGTVTIKNSTFSGNTATSGAGNTATSSFGGGVHTLNGFLKIYNTTVTANAATTGRGVYIFSAAGTATVEVFSSIIAEHDTPLSRDVVALADTDGQLVLSGSNNIIRTHVGFEQVGLLGDDPLLTPLADNGGPTLTHQPQGGSPAIGNGNNLLNLATDQRGATFTRMVGGAVDIGAFEVQSSAPELPGDYNIDHIVNAADYVLWRKTMGSNVETYAGADGNGSGTVDPVDYTVWTENFGEDTLPGLGASEFMSDAVQANIAASKSPAAAESVAIRSIAFESFTNSPASFGGTLSKKRSGVRPMIRSVSFDSRTGTAGARDAALAALIARGDLTSRASIGGSEIASDVKCPAGSNDNGITARQVSSELPY
ncbi:MAG: hypothetical protein L0228_05720, partial [Planctomycetes bacterium]|nr:hypothetical protein [Planctomycetota bacterium]